MLTRPRSLTAILLVAGLALSVTAAASGGEADGAQTDEVRTASQLPVATLLEHLPADYEEAGFEFPPMLLSVTAPTPADRTALASAGFDVTEHAGHDSLEVVVHSQEQLDLLHDLHYESEVEIADMVVRERERILADAEFHAANQVTELPSQRTTYRVLQDYLDELDQLAADNPDIAKRIVIGESIESRELAGIEIGVGVNDPEDGRPVLLMFGAHHAREWPSAETPMEFAHDLISTFNAGDPRTVELLGRTRVVIVPVSNPDGFDASRSDGDLIDLNLLQDQDPLGGTTVILATPGNAYKRKNCRIVDGQTQPPGPCRALSSPGGQGAGIDLNRNYGALWGGPGAVGTEPEAGQSINGAGVLSPIYRGPAPFSEPETQAIRELISTRQVTTLISNHTFSNLLLRPVGVEPTTGHPDGFPVGFAPDECFTTADGSDLGMQALGEQMTAQTGYTNQFGWELYDTTGTTEDYSYNATGGYGYTFEIGPDEFHPPFEDVVAEYTGDTAVANAITTDTAANLTTSTARDCEGDPVEHDTVGGGLREAYYIALANAANTATHSVLTGEAPAGATIGVTRTGTFPLWDGTPFEDTVATTMTVPGGDVQAAAVGDGPVPFTYHVNPSTRPFEDSRAYLDPDAPAPERVEIRQENEIGAVPPNEEADVLFTVEPGEGIESIVVSLTNATVPTDDYDIELYSPDAVVIGDSGNFPGEDEEITFNRIGGNGVQPGTYAVRIINYAALGNYDLTISLGHFPDYQPPAELDTPAATEAWTVTCTMDDEELAREEVVVGRGEAVDLGEFCVLAAGEDLSAAPDPEGDLAATGGGAAALAAMLLGGAVALAGRRRRQD